MPSLYTLLSIKLPKVLIVCVSVCLGLHLLSAIGVGFLYPHIISPAADQLEYRTIALNLLDYQAFSIAPPASNNPDMMRTPGYPFFVAFTYFFDRTGFLAIFLQQLMLGVMGILLYFLLRYFSVTEKIAIALVAVFLLEPQQWFYSLQTMTETLSSFLFIILFALSFLASRVSPARHALIFGFLLGLLILVKPTLVVLAPFLLMLLLVFKKGIWQRSVFYGVLAGCIMLLVVSPWLIRNYLLTRTLTLSVSPAYVLSDGFGTPAEKAMVNGGEPLYNEAHQQVGIAVQGYSSKGFATMIQLAENIVGELGIWGIAKRQLACTPRVWLTLSQTYEMLGGTVSYRLASPAFYVGWMLAVFVALLSFLGLVALFFKKQFRVSAVVLFGMLAVVTYMNLCVAYARTLIPIYPIIFIGVGISITFFFSKLR